jgi:hypothetical protein
MSFRRSQRVWAGQLEPRSLPRRQRARSSAHDRQRLGDGPGRRRELGGLADGDPAARPTATSTLSFSGT